MKSHERIKTFLQAIGITAGIAFLFYRSLAGMLLLPIVWKLQKSYIATKRKEQKMQKLREEFLHGIEVLNSSLQAGLSMENSWREVEKDARCLYGERSEFYTAIKEMNQRIAHNMPMEKLFLGVAYQCNVEEMIQFAELLEFAKRSGGKWKQMIDVTASQMKEREEAKLQIEVMVAEKRMEQKVMNMIPLGLLAFLQFSAWDYLAVLYHNWFGVITMTLFLLGYAGAIFLSEKILRVEV